MLIKQEGEAKGKCESSTYEEEYQTANELFDLMSRQHNLSTDDSLTARDLVILYENIEIGTKLLSEAKQKKTRGPNQLVETIVYNEESETDTNDSYSNADLLHLCRTNEEAFDLLQSHSSLDNTLCRKRSRMELPAFHNSDYDKFYLLKDPFLKEHLKNLRSSSMDFDSQMLPSTLLDYLCCKRLEDNYKFNMDNIIRYVTHTIEQLKRISNGDYLTEKAKEVWREVPEDDIDTKKKSPKMLATCTSFPLHIERKKTGTPSFWDDIVHSEVDLRSLSKVLEKKLFLEIPKIICGSFKLFSKQCAENLIIRCQQSTSETEKIDKPKESRVDVVLKLGRSESGQVISNMNSIMILGELSTEVHDGVLSGGMLALPAIEPFEGKEEATVDLKIIEISDNRDNTTTTITEDNVNKSNSSDVKDLVMINTLERKAEENITEKSQEEGSIYDYDDAEEVNTTNDVEKKEHETNLETSSVKDLDDVEFEENGGSSIKDPKSDLKEAIKDPPSDLKEVIEGNFLPIYEQCRRRAFSEDFHLTIQTLAMPDTLPEETDDNLIIPLKKKSSPTVRVKSPYENKSRVLEDKKRKKLLEIKEKREKKRNSLNDNSKITKHKFNNRSQIAPQATGSVTKLSITNKSFYNSIYGKKQDLENNLNKRHRKKSDLSDITLNEDSYSYVKDIIEIPDKKHENSYFELSGSVGDPDQIIQGQETLSYYNDNGSYAQYELADTVNLDTNECEKELEMLDTVESELQSDDLSSKNKKTNSMGGTGESSLPTTFDCRESIDKIYDLMNKMESSFEISDFFNLEEPNLINSQNNNKTTRDSECSSTKPQSASSNPSNESFVKPVTKVTTPRNIEPKVIISNKVQSIKEENKKGKRKSYYHGPAAKPVSENPLKAISQLIHDIDNVKKNNKQKISFDSKSKKSEDPQKENRVRLRFSADSKILDDRNRSPMDKHRLNPNFPRSAQKVHITSQPGRSSQRSGMDDGRNKLSKKKLEDFMDEVKEARGEAVRGPTKFNSRLNTLAQPKKSYVQAHNQEYQSRHGRSLTADRLQRLAATERNSKNKQRGTRHEFHPNPKHHALTVSPIDTPRIRRSRSNSPNALQHKNKMFKHNSVNFNMVPKKPSAIASSIKSQHGTEGSQKMQQISRAQKSHANARFQAPSLNLEYPEMGINTVISTIPMDYKRSELDIKSDKNNTPLSITFEKIGSLIPEDGSGDEEEESTTFTINSAPIKIDAKIKVKDETELTRLEKALLNEKPSSPVQKRLRMKNFTLTPKQSLQHVLIVHSGDGSSVLLNRNISQKFKVNTSKSDMIYPFKTLSGYITNMPLQMLTVGYAFQQYPGFSTKCKGNVTTSNSSIILCQNKKDIRYELPNAPVASKEMVDKISDMHINIHCPKAVPPEVKKRSNENLKTTADLKCTKSAMDIISKIEYGKLSPSKIRNSVENKDSTIIETDVNFSTSLDILVDLLSEIKKITTCQPQISSEKHHSKEIIDLFNNSIRNDKEIATNVNIGISTSLQSDINTISQFRFGSHDLDIFNNPFRNNSISTNFKVDISTNVQNDLYSFTQLPYLDTQELYLRNLKSQSAIISCNKAKTVYDKELNVNLNEKQYKNKVTETSQIVVMSVSESTSVSNALLDLWSKPSFHTDHSESDYYSMGANASLDSVNTARLTNIVIDKESKMLYKHDDKKQIVSKPCVKSKVNCASLNTKNTIDIKFKRCEMKQCINGKRSGLDNVMKFKRDVLVTVYSIFVLTIFAAISLPQVM